MLKKYTFWSKATIVLQFLTGMFHSLRHLLLLIFFSIKASCYAQTETELKTLFYAIKNIPYSSNSFKDSSYSKILKHGTAAIPTLINLLTDTTITSINNKCSNQNCRQGDIAFFLINNIEFVPYSKLTATQWCIVGNCGSIPDGFFEYFNKNRKEFQQQYLSYFYSKERIKFIQSIRRAKARYGHNNQQPH